MDPVVLGLAVAVGILGVSLVVMAFILRAVRAKIDAFAVGKEAGDLEDVMRKLTGDIADAHAAIKAHDTHFASVDTRLHSSIQKVGIIRFNPFKEEGGDYSFAIALLDEADNGVVLSSLYVRDGVRVYAKPVTAGKSSYPFSDEEEAAMKQAITRQ